MGAGTPMERIRIREKNHNHFGKILRDEMSKNDIYIYNNRSFVAELLPREEKLCKMSEQTVFFTQRWYRSTWGFGPRTEITVDSSASVSSVAEQLGEIHGIDPRNLRVVHLKSNSYVNVCDLHKTSLGYYDSWVEEFGRHETMKSLITVKDDGNMLLVQDSSEDLRTFTAEENSVIERLKPSYGNDLSVNYGTGSGYKNRRPMERGIKIKTQADWEREEQEEKSSKEESEGQNITVNANDHGSVSSSGTNDGLYLFDNIS